MPVLDCDFTRSLGGGVKVSSKADGKTRDGENSWHPSFFPWAYVELQEPKIRTARLWRLDRRL